MSETHTPGPWAWSGRWLRGETKLILWYTTNDDGVHCSSPDASLIAAAPQLLSALKAIELGLGTLVYTAEVHNALLDEARAAIASAEPTAAKIRAIDEAIQSVEGKP